MKISIAIPTYNNQDTIIPCIKSVLTNTNKPNKIMIIDKDSTDQTIRRLNIFFNKNNQQDFLFNGIHIKIMRILSQEYSIVIKNCLQLSQDCDIIGLLNGKNIYYKNKIARCKQAFELDNIILAVTNDFVFKKKNCIKPSLHEPFDSMTLGRYDFYDDNIMIKTNILPRLEDFKNHVELLSQISRFGVIYHIPEILHEK